MALRVPLRVPVDMRMPTEALAKGLPNWSSTSTVTAPSELPAVALAGCEANEIFAADAVPSNVNKSLGDVADVPPGW